MKKIFVLTFLAASLIACNSSGDSKEEKKNGAAADDLSSNPDYQAGLAVIGKNDCLTCHKVDEKLNGPSYREVANRYADSSKAEIVPHLAKKIIEGGQGVWGEVPMIPHPALTQEEAEAAVKYVLLLKK